MDGVLEIYCTLQAWKSQWWWLSGIINVAETSGFSNHRNYMIVSNLHKWHSWVLQTGQKLVLHCWAIDYCNCKHKQKDFLHSERVSEGDRFGLHLVFEPVHDSFITTPFLQEWEVCVQEKPLVTSCKRQTIHRDIDLHHTKHHRKN
jgi:hypothetical protein